MSEAHQGQLIAAGVSKEYQTIYIKDIDSEATLVPQTENNFSVETATSAGPAKRKHDEVERGTEDEGPIVKTRATYKKDATHWISDGNILIQIGKKRFKLHRSRLVSESDWFQALVDQHAGLVPESPFKFQEEIDSALKSAEKVDGMDLFHIEPEDGPKPMEFSALLTAMYNGIDYVYNPPNFDVMARILRASYFFRMTRYITFCEAFFNAEFPDDWQSLGSEPSPHAIKAIRIGYDLNFIDILPSAFYDVARLPPPPSPITKDDMLVTGLAADLGKLKRCELVYLLKLQKHLSTAWESIRSIMEYACRGDKDECQLAHGCRTAYKNMKTRYPFDPIRGITSILESGTISKAYCDNADKAVRRQLMLERDLIWNNIKVWLDINP